MAEKQILSLKPALRLEQVGDENSERVQDCKHRSQGCDDSALRCESRPDGIFGKDTGILDPLTPVLAGIVGAVLGDAISFWLGQKFGPQISNMWPFRHHPQRLESGIVFFERYGTASVFIGRFFGPLRAVIPLAAGILHMPTRRFYIANVLSAIVWAPALIFSGDLLAHSLRAESLATRIFLITVFIAVLALLGPYAWRRLILR